MKCPLCTSTTSFARNGDLRRHQDTALCVKHRIESTVPPANVAWVQDVSRWKFKHPATIMMCGPTGSGKTTVLIQLIKRGMFDPLPKHIIVFHGEQQDIYKQFPAGTSFIKGWSPELVENVPNDSLVIIDDLMSEVKDCPQLSKLYTKMSHHRNISVVWLTQNLFPRGKQCRDISLNSQYILLFRNPRDQAQVCFVAYVYSIPFD